MSARTFDDIALGDTLGPVTVPVTREQLKAYAAASLDDNPIHQDEAFAKSVGLPDLIAHGMWTMGATGAVVSDWAGDAGRVRSYGTRFTKMVVVPPEGAEIVVTGEVVAVEPEARTVTLELTTTAAGEKVLGRCSAVVALD